jgi:hypothetical protein
MQPSSRFTHPASIATAALVALALFVAIVLAIPASSSAVPAASAASTPSVSARINSCVGGFTYDARKIEFSGRMSALTGSTGGKMLMRFDVLRKFDGATRYRLLSADGLGEWLGNTEPTATVFVRNVALSQIETGAHYKARVGYRWLDQNNKIVAKTVRTTKVCKQRAPLPNLKPFNLLTFPNPGQSLTSYEVSVYNASKSEAENVTVSLAIDGKTPVTKTVDSIAGRGVADLIFTGMDACTVERYVRIDPQNTVREQNELDNDVRTGC